MLLFFSNEFIANEVMGAWEIRPTPFSAMKKDYAFGILLCGVAKTEVGPPDRVYIGSGADRINHTMQLYKMGRIRKILVSGGSGQLNSKSKPEADEIASLLRLMGVPRKDILIENASRNTHESAVAVKEMLQARTTPQECLLITSADHLRRSAACFRKEGWPTDSFSTDFFSHPRKFSFDVLLVPKFIKVAYAHLLHARYIFPDIGYAETPFFEFPFISLFINQLRVNEDLLEPGHIFLFFL